MTNKKTLEKNRILSEMLEMAQALQGHALITKQNMTKMNLLCQKAPEYTPEKVTAIRLKKAKVNPGYIPGKPCVYVGMTGLDPDVRFDKHKAGIQSNRYVKEYGLRLLPDLYEGFNPMSYDEARDREVEVGIDLREAGFGVWQA